jgi:hypothetical protein
MPEPLVSAIRAAESDCLRLMSIAAVYVDKSTVADFALVTYHVIVTENSEYVGISKWTGPAVAILPP